jgi:hypothetical protein
LVETEKTASEELLEAKQKIIELEASTKTTLTGSQFLVIILVGPLFMAFVTLGVLIVYKVTSKPAEVAPHLDVILLALSIFSLPVTSAAAAIVGIMSDELKAKIGEKKNEG